MKTSESINAGPVWMETEARVTACRYQFARLHTLTLGVDTGAGPFLIHFNYYAHGKSYDDSFRSPVAIGQGETLTIRYNALDPKQNTKSMQSPANSLPLFAIGVAGSILLSLIYLAVVRGCN